MSDKKELKVAILGSRGIPARYGGYETVVEEISKRLVKMGVDVTVFCPSDNEYKKHDYNGVRLSFVGNFEKRFGPIGMLLYDFLSLLKSSFSNFNIVYMLGYSSALFCIIPRMLGKKVVINTDGLEWKRSKWSKLAKLYLRLNELASTKIANVLISDSLEIKKYFMDKFGVDSAYITNGAYLFYSKNNNIVRKYGLKPMEYYLIVARLEPENNIDTIVKGFVQTNSKKKLLLITNIKKSKYYYKVKNLCEKDRRVVFFGPLYNKEELNEIRANAFAYIHGHSVGGTNPSLLESMACGNFVIAYDVPFNREVLRNSGYFFKDEFELKNCIEKLESMSNRNVIKLGRKNRTTIKKHYSWDKVCLGYINLFKKLVS
jgi:glycosyltransferase involved in cell wall biosynthesis